MIYFDFSFEEQGLFIFNFHRDTLYARDAPREPGPPYWLRTLEMAETSSCYRFKKFAIHESLIKSHRLRRIAAFMKLEELIIVVGTATTTTRTKILVNGRDLDIKDHIWGGPAWEGKPYNSGRWGRGNADDHLRRGAKIGSLMESLKEEADKTKKKMPVVKIMVLCEKELRNRF